MRGGQTGTQLPQCVSGLLCVWGQREPGQVVVGEWCWRQHTYGMAEEVKGISAVVSVASRPTQPLCRCGGCCSDACPSPLSGRTSTSLPFLSVVIGVPTSCVCAAGCCHAPLAEPSLCRCGGGCSDRPWPGHRHCCCWRQPAIQLHQREDGTVHRGQPVPGVCGSHCV